MEARIDGRTLRYQHRRGELLDAVAEYVLDNGVSNLSLRRVAESVGVSHVTLRHHFGSKEELVGEIVEHLLDRTLMPQWAYTSGTPEPGLDLAGRLRALWAHLSSPSGQRDIRLFTEVLGESLFEGSDYSVAVGRSIRHRRELITLNLVLLGCPERDALSYATLTLATFRGLITEMLATGERERLDAAFEIVIANTERHVLEWAPDATVPPVLIDRRARD